MIHRFIRRILLLCLPAALSAGAQVTGTTTGPQSSSSIVRRAEQQRTRDNDRTSTGVTSRMEQHFSGNADNDDTPDAGTQWMRVIYRHIDLDKGGNAALYYPEDADGGNENLFRIMLRLLASNTVPAYEYLGGKEIFTEETRVNVKEMLDRFHVMYTDAKGSTEKNPKVDIDPSDVPANEVLSYYIIEKWEFDNRANRTTATVEAICPVLHRTGDLGGEAVRYPMFWMRTADIRPWLAKQQIFLSDDNNLPTCTLDDFFTMNLYEGDIYKTRNLRNRSMAELYPDPDNLRRAQDSIHHRLTSFDDHLWVPSREEVMAQNGSSDSIAPAEKVSNTRARRESPRKPAKTKATQTKPKTSSSSAERSVKRRRR